MFLLGTLVSFVQKTKEKKDKEKVRTTKRKISFFYQREKKDWVLDLEMEKAERGMYEYR